MANKQFDQSHIPPVRRFRMRRQRRQPVGRSRASYDQSPAAMPKPTTEAMNPVQTDTPTDRSQTKARDLGWPLLWLSTILVFGGTAASAFFWLITMPPPIDCSKISLLSPDMERLQCAQQAAASRKVDRLIQGLALVKDWPQDNPLSSQAEQLRDEWSEWLLEIAQQKIEGGDLKAAVEIANKIPKNASVYNDAQAVVNTWKNDWDKGQAIYNKALESIKAQDWQQATAYTQELSRLRNEHWGQQRLTELLKQITREKEAWRQLKESRDLAGYETPDDLEGAIALVRKIGANTYAYAAAKADIAKWSRKLLDMAAKRLQEKDLEGAISVAKKIPSESSLYAEAQDFIQLSTAKTLVPETPVSSGPLEASILALVEAQSAARQIAPGRPLYGQAQAKIAEWQGQMQDLVQLQMASTLASVGQGVALQMAIDQAQEIGPNRPKRLHAQTLIAQWRKELAVANDRPFVARAQQLAASGTIEGLKTAIAEARQVNQGRPLRLEAQTLIASWNKQIETLEDRPFLEQAQALAKKGEISNAIRSAEKIKRGRALYAQAQEAIADWQSQIQIAEDRPLLNEATKLAAQGRLSEAIQKASQIAYGRALYYEAQEGIARWAAERMAIRAAQEASVARDTYSPPAEQYSPPAEQYSPPAEQYSPPAEQYSPPAEQYSPPAEQYSPPAEQYSPPAEQYSPPAEPYYPPAEQYSPPAEPYYPPAEQYSPPAQSYSPPAQEQPAPVEPPAAAPPPAAEPLPIDGIE